MRWSDVATMKSKIPRQASAARVAFVWRLVVMSPSVQEAAVMVQVTI